MPRPLASRPPSDMRNRIKAVTTEMLIRRGLHGTSHRLIAERLGITTTSIHYHFGTKQGLIDEVVADYVEEAIAQQTAMWSAPAETLADKLRAVVEYNHRRYKKYNRGRLTGRTWSLIGRLRLEGDALSPKARGSLLSFPAAVHKAISIAVRQAWERGELKPDAPLDDLSFLLVNIVNSSSTFVQDAGNFEGLEHFFDAFARVMLAAYAATPEPPISAPAPGARRHTRQPS